MSVESLSAERLDKIKALKLSEYIRLPMIYSEEINDIFFTILPQLVIIAEDHAHLVEVLQKIEKDSYHPTHFNEESLHIFRSLMNEEDNYIHALEMDLQSLRSHYSSKYDALRIIAPVRPIEDITWYKRIWVAIKNSLK